MPRAKHRSAVIHSAALHELRRRHPEEFQTIFDDLCKERGVILQNQQTKETKEKILDHIAQCHETFDKGPGPHAIAEALSIPISSTVKWLRELRDEGSVIAPGAGNRQGYRLTEAVNASMSE